MTSLDDHRKTLVQRCFHLVDASQVANPDICTADVSHVPWMRAAWPRRWHGCACPAPGRGDLAPARTGCWPTRRTPPQASAPCCARGIEAIIPVKDDQVRHRASRGRASGRPPTFDPIAYKARNSVERTINRLCARAVALRTDKRPYVCTGSVNVASIDLWLRDHT